jgi:tetratricopeptide (TPR) repeat protein
MIDDIAVIQQADPRLGSFFRSISHGYRISNNRADQATDVSPPSPPTSSPAFTESTRAALLLIPEFLASLDCEFFTLYKQHGDIMCLHMSVATSRLSVDCTPGDDETLPGRLESLGASLHARFHQLGERVDIEEAFLAQRFAADLTPGGHPERSTYLSTLRDYASLMDFQKRPNELPDGGRAYEPRSELLREASSAFSATASEQRVSSVRLSGNRDNHGYLDNLARILRLRFKRLQHLSDIEDAVALHRSAVEHAPDGHASKPIYLNNLAFALETRFEALDERQDIEDAVASRRRAVELIPDEHPDKPVYVDSLSSTLSSRFREFGELSDLDDAVLSKLHAADLKPNVNSSTLSSLPVLLHHPDINAVITTQRAAINMTPDGHPEKPGQLTNLAISLLQRFQQLAQTSDLDDASEAMATALNLTPNGHHEMTMRLRQFGLVWKGLMSDSRSQHHFRLAYDSFMDAVHGLSPGLPIEKLQAALDATEICDQFPQYVNKGMLLKTHKSVLDAIPPLVWLGQSVSHRYNQLSRHRIGAAIIAAASAAISVGNTSLALEWLEEGRSIVWAQLLRLRSPLEDLRDINPQIADMLEHASSSLQMAGYRGIAGVTESRSALEAEARQHREFALNYDNLLSRARELGFLRPKTLEELASVCRGGPVAVINAHSSRCDALVFCRPGHIVHIPLPECTVALAEAARASLVSCLRGRAVRGGARGPARSDYNDTMLDILELLWVCIVKPILSVVESEVGLTLLRWLRDR